jgi:hypothetical protein
MGSINAMDAYTDYYNLPPEGNSGTGIVFAIFQIGQMAGALFTWAADWKGRRWPIFLGCIGVCVASIVTANAPTLAGFIGGRFLLSFCSTIAATAAPLYLIELAPPQYRGTIAGMYNTLYYLVGLFPSAIHRPNRSAGFNHCDLCRLWLESPFDRQPLMAAINLASNDLSRPSCSRGVVYLSRISTLVSALGGEELVSHANT